MNSLNPGMLRSIRGARKFNPLVSYYSTILKTRKVWGLVAVMMKGMKRVNEEKLLLSNIKRY